MDLDTIFESSEALHEALKRGFHIGDYMFVSSEGLTVHDGEEFRVGPFVGTCLFKGSCITTMKMTGQFRSWDQYNRWMGVKK